MSRQGNQHIGASRDRQHETEVGAAEQGQVGDHPQRQDEHARDCPRVRERARIIQRRCGNNFAHLAHPVAERDVANDITGDHH